MLTELTIRNYTLIESLQIEFVNGLNVLTGETGAGKSIIIDALGLLLGEKGTVGMVRKGCEKCEINGLFGIEENRLAKEFLKSLSLENTDEEDSLFVRREIDLQGKSRSFINDKAVKLSTLSDLGDLLVDIHGQHEHQRLLKSNQQRDFLDGYAKVLSLREEISTLYSEWKGWVEQRANSQLSEQEKNQKIDLYRFQLQEIDSAKLNLGDEEEIERMLPQLKNSEKLRVLAEDLFSQLYDSDGSISERLHKSQKLLESIMVFGIDMKNSSALLSESIVGVNEVINHVDSFRKSLVFDPQKLDQIISHQDLIFKLKKKYGATVAEIFKYREKINEDLKRIESHSETIQDLDQKIVETYDRLFKQCRKLSALRKKFVNKLSRSVEKELKCLGFHKARFCIQLNPQRDENGQEVPSPTGLEKVEFLFSANPGEDMQALKNVVSGGELSRVMLALKKIFAQVDSVPTLIFDEVDSGIGGSMAHVVGEKLKSLSRSHQVFAITHLPQIAAFAQRHIAVRKNVIEGRTITVSEVLENKMRIEEIARMLGGGGGGGGSGSAAGDKQPTPTSLKHASELLESV